MSKQPTEQTALLTEQPVQGVPAQPLKAPREWRGKWYAFCGDFSAPDVVSCLLAWKLPFVAWSWNQNRTMGFSFFWEMLRFVFITLGFFATLHVGCCLIMMALCPEGREMHDDGEDMSMRKMLHVHHHEDDEHHNHHHGHWGDEGPDGPHGIPKECIARIAPAYLALAALGITLFVYITLFFARRRTAIRERFGIDGTRKEDCLLYAFCAPCALAQETRTLMHEQVHDGVWYGALPGVAPPSAVAVPTAQKMVV